VVLSLVPPPPLSRVALRRRRKTPYVMEQLLPPPPRHTRARKEAPCSSPPYRGNKVPRIVPTDVGWNLADGRIVVPEDRIPVIVQWSKDKWETGALHGTIEKAVQTCTPHATREGMGMHRGELYVLGASVGLLIDPTPEKEPYIFCDILVTAIDIEYQFRWFDDWILLCGDNLYHPTTMGKILNETAMRASVMEGAGRFLRRVTT